MTIIIRILLIAIGIAVMWFEGQHQPAPGIGFAIALICFGAAALWGAKIGQDMADCPLCMGPTYRPGEICPHCQDRIDRAGRP